jgi:hypothetical protein
VPFNNFHNVICNIITSQIYSHITDNSIRKLKLGIHGALYFNHLEDEYDICNV